MKSAWVHIPNRSCFVLQQIESSLNWWQKPKFLLPNNFKTENCCGIYKLARFWLYFVLVFHPMAKRMQKMPFKECSESDMVKMAKQPQLLALKILSCRWMVHSDPDFHSIHPSISIAFCGHCSIDYAQNCGVFKFTITNGNESDLFTVNFNFNKFIQHNSSLDGAFGAIVINFSRI